jgi:hypothetical protein
MGQLLEPDGIVHELAPLNVPVMAGAEEHMLPFQGEPEMHADVMVFCPSNIELLYK